MKRGLKEKTKRKRAERREEEENERIEDLFTAPESQATVVCQTGKKKIKQRREGRRRRSRQR
jgi:hypothetical protein